MYKYPHQPDEIIPRESTADILTDAVNWADFVWIVQSDLPALMGGTYGQCSINPSRTAWLEKMAGKQIVLLHGGGHFRDNRELYQSIFEPFDPISLCYEADLMGSFKNEHLVIPPINPAWVEEVERTWGGLRVGHFPSRPTDKGSEWIVPLLKGKPVEFRTSVTDPYNEEGVVRVTWPQQIHRIAACDVVIDQIKPELNGKPFGEWVSIGLEAAMCGCISIANSLNPQPYVETYGRMPGIHICNTEADLSREIDRLAGLDDAQIRKEKRESKHWAYEFHSLRPTGLLLQKLCGL